MGIAAAGQALTAMKVRPTHAQLGELAVQAQLPDIL